VLVTGASTGIGAATVRALVDQGDRVWPGVRSEVDARRLASEYGERVRVLRVIQAVLPAVRAGAGRIVVVGSIGGRIAGPMLGAYSRVEVRRGGADRLVAG
jgi:NAD(P)-dependent dehydrogenase (short-subunit alcohol dehydrogenase family)